MLFLIFFYFSLVRLCYYEQSVFANGAWTKQTLKDQNVEDQLCSNCSYFILSLEKDHFDPQSLFIWDQSSKWLFLLCGLILTLPQHLVLLFWVFIRSRYFLGCHLVNFSLRWNVRRYQHLCEMPAFHLKNIGREEFYPLDKLSMAGTATTTL